MEQLKSFFLLLLWVEAFWSKISTRRGGWKSKICPLTIYEGCKCIYTRISLIRLPLYRGNMLHNMAAKSGRGSWLLFLLPLPWISPWAPTHIRVRWCLYCSIRKTTVVTVLLKHRSLWAPQKCLQLKLSSGLLCYLEIYFCVATTNFIMFQQVRCVCVRRHKHSKVSHTQDKT